MHFWSGLTVVSSCYGKSWVSMLIYCVFRLWKNVGHSLSLSLSLSPPPLSSFIFYASWCAVCNGQLLQELDNYEEWWLPQLTAAGYDCVYKHRTKATGVHRDGIAIAARRNLFQFYKTMDIEFVSGSRGEGFHHPFSGPSLYALLCPIFSITPPSHTIHTTHHDPKRTVCQSRSMMKTWARACYKTMSD